MKKAKPAQKGALHRESVGERLDTIYRRLLERYGPQGWWPGDDLFEIAIGAILTQSTNWSNVEKVLNALKQAHVLSPGALQDIPEKELARLIYSSGYYNAKARKIKALVQYLADRFNGDIGAIKREDMQELRSDLLKVHGIGEETADDLLLYIAEKASFVVDAYTRRIVDRLGLSPGAKTYEAYQRLFMDSLPHDPHLFNEYHALLVALGKSTCRKRPLCAECCLLDVCPTGQAEKRIKPSTQRR